MRVTYTLTAEQIARLDAAQPRSAWRTARAFARDPFTWLLLLAVVAPGLVLAWYGLVWSVAIGFLAAASGVLSRLGRSDPDDGDGLGGALGGDGEGVDAAAQAVALHDIGEETVPDLLPGVDGVVAGGAEAFRPSGDGLELRRGEAAGVDGGGDDAGAVALAEVGDAVGGVESAGEGEDEGLGLGGHGDDIRKVSYVYSGQRWPWIRAAGSFRGFLRGRPGRHVSPYPGAEEPRAPTCGSNRPDLHA